MTKCGCHELGEPFRSALGGENGRFRTRVREGDGMGGDGSRCKLHPSLRWDGATSASEELEKRAV